MNAENQIYDENSVDWLQRNGFAPEEIREALYAKMEIVPHNTYPQHRLVTTALSINGRRLNNVQVINDLKRGGIFKSTSRYHVYPHDNLKEDLFLCADEMSLKLKLVEDARTSERSGHAYYHNLRNEDGMTVSKDGRFMMSSYTVENLGEFAVADTKYKAGFTLVNSVDGSTPILIIPFDVNLACMNQMIHTLKAIRAQGDQSLVYSKVSQLAESAWAKHPTLEHKFNTFDNFLEEASKTRFIHTKKYERETLIANIALKLELIKDFMSVYPKLTKTELTKPFVEKAIGITSSYDTALPINLVKSLRSEQAGFKVTRKDKEWKLGSIYEGTTQDDFLQEITYQLSHNPSERTTVTSRLGAYRKINTLFGFGQAEQEIIPTAN